MAYSDLEVLREAQWRQAQRDPVYFLNNFVHVSTPDRGRVLLDTTRRPHQEEVVRILRGDYGRKAVNLKARQIGITTTCAAYTLWETFYQADRYTLFISRRELDAKDILAKADYAYRWLPDWMKDRGPRRMDDASQVMTFANDSLIRSEQSRSDPARGQTATLIIADEFATLPDQEESWASMEPVADIGGRIFILSTAKGIGNLFHAMCMGARTGRNGFHFVFFPWSVVPGRDEAWFEEKVKDLLPWIRAQEYPSDPDEAFVQSGNMVFDLDALRRHEVAVLSPQWFQADAGYRLVPYTGRVA